MSNKAINILKVGAMISVFMLHTSIFSSKQGFAYSDKTWILQTPAWAAVWVFIFVSGYLNSKNFKNIQSVTKNNIFLFYKKKLIKVYIPYIVFGIFTVLLLEPEYFQSNNKFIIQLFIARFTNDPGSVTVGVLWYVSTLLWLYLFTPLFSYIINLINKNISNIKIVIQIIFILSLGLIWRLYMKKTCTDWSSQVYVPFYANFDIYICGMLIRKLEIKTSRIIQIVADLLMVALLLFNIRIYYLGNYNYFYINLYCYVLPSVYIIVLSLFILGNKNKNYYRCKLLGKIIDFFSDISFEFYMSHCIMLNALVSLIQYTQNANIFHIKMLIFAFILTTIFAFFLHKAFAGVYNEKIKDMKKKNET